MQTRFLVHILSKNIRFFERCRFRNSFATSRATRYPRLAGFALHTIRKSSVSDRSSRARKCRAPVTMESQIEAIFMLAAESPNRLLAHIAPAIAPWRSTYGWDAVAP